MAVQPLRLEELAEVLAFDFEDAPRGVPKLNVDWRQEDQGRAVLSACSSLITIVHDGGDSRRVVQFSHFPVKEFLTSDRLAAAAGDISFHHIPLAPAHKILAQACLGVLLRSDDTTWGAFVQRFPLAQYALEHWVDHVLFEDVSLRIKDGIEDLFDLEKSHFLRWIRVRGNMDDYSWPEPDARPEQLEAAPMYCAAFCGLHDVMEKLIREHPEHIGAKAGPLGTALHAASREHHLKAVQSLLRHGADVNAPGAWGRTPLLFASVHGRLEAVLCLLEYGADVNAKDKDDDWTSLHLAAAMGHFGIARTLLKKNADTASRGNAGHTPLHLASSNRRVDIVGLLLGHGANPQARDKEQQTSLHLASASGNVDIAHLLLENGVDVDAKNNRGSSAYQIALDKRHDEVAQLLLAHGAESRM